MERLFKESAAAQRAYRQRLLSGCSFHLRYQVQPNSQNLGPEDSFVVCDFPNRVSEQAKRVSGVTPSYGFHLSRSDDQRTWQVTDVSTSGALEFLLSEKTEVNASFSLEELLFDEEILLLDVGRLPIERFLASSDVEIQSAAEDDSGRVAVKFAGPVKVPFANMTVLGGKIWLSPRKSWAVDEYSVDVLPAKPEEPKIPRTHHRKVKWIEVGGVPVPEEVSTCFLRDGELVREQRSTYRDWKLSDLPVERFQLGHYGLPEPGVVDA